MHSLDFLHVMRAELTMRCQLETLVQRAVLLFGRPVALQPWWSALLQLSFWRLPTSFQHLPVPQLQCAAELHGRHLPRTGGSLSAAACNFPGSFQQHGLGVWGRVWDDVRDPATSVLQSQQILAGDIALHTLDWIRMWSYLSAFVFCLSICHCGIVTNGML